MNRIEQVSLLLVIAVTGLLSCQSSQNEAHTTASQSNNATTPSTASVPLYLIKDPDAFTSQLQRIRSPHITASASYLYQKRTGTSIGNASAAPGETAYATTQAYPLMAALWPTSVIDVCWENPTPKFRSQMQQVQQAIAATWQAASQLQFTGWQQCPSLSPVGKQVIRIVVSDSDPQNGPRTLGLGSQLSGVPQGMLLNFTFLHWSPTCQTMLDYCIKGIAVHEFGHAIGFAHEQNRPDTPGECMQPPQGDNGDNTQLTPYDRESVMNYCNKKYNNNGQLSALDKEAVAALYGPPIGH